MSTKAVNSSYATHKPQHEASDSNLARYQARLAHDLLALVAQITAQFCVLTTHVLDCQHAIDHGQHTIEEHHGASLTVEFAVIEQQCMQLLTSAELGELWGDECSPDLLVQQDARIDWTNAHAWVGMDRVSETYEPSQPVSVRSSGGVKFVDDLMRLTDRLHALQQLIHARIGGAASSFQLTDANSVHAHRNAALQYAYSRRVALLNPSINAIMIDIVGIESMQEIDRLLAYFANSPGEHLIRLVGFNEDLLQFAFHSYNPDELQRWSQQLATDFLIHDIGDTYVRASIKAETINKLS